MILHAGIMALLLGSGLTSAMVGYSAWQGVLIIRRWDLRSGSEIQLELERRTYLVSTIMSYAMAFQGLSLFLFIYTADSLSPMFIGAMCAAGTLKVNSFGYPALVGKTATCLLSGLWLILNATDNKAPDYPLIRIKYWFLLLFTPLVFAETVLQGAYLLSLRPNIITSCCALIFSAESNTVISDLVSLPKMWLQIPFTVSTLITLALGLSVILKAKGALLFSMASLLQLILAIGTLISVISVYIYEIPTHHCPFCLLHTEYYSIGYMLYGALFLSAITGIGTGLINQWWSIPSLKAIIPRLQLKMAVISVCSNVVFVVTSGLIIWSSNLKL